MAAGRRNFFKIRLSKNKEDLRKDSTKRNSLYMIIHQMQHQHCKKTEKKRKERKIKIKNSTVRRWTQRSKARGTYSVTYVSWTPIFEWWPVK